MQTVLAAGTFREAARPDSVMVTRAQRRTSKKNIGHGAIDLEQAVLDDAKEQFGPAPPAVILVQRTVIANAHI